MDDKILFVWDFHGVLEKDNEHAVHEVCTLVLKEFGIDREVSLQQVIDWYGLSWFDYYRLAVPEGSQKLWKDMVNRTFNLRQKGWDIIRKHIKPRDYSKEVLRTIKEKGHYNIVLSNSRPDHAKGFTKVIGVIDYLDGVIGADDTHYNSRLNAEIQDIKAEILSNFLKDKNYKKVIVIGDKDSDIKAGKKCGAVTYLFFDPEINKNPDEAGADYIISDLRDILKELD